MGRKPVRTAVIGVGNMGKNHVRIYSTISSLTAVADSDVRQGREIASSYGVPYYRDYRKMIVKEKIDAVSVVVPTKLHHVVAQDTLRAGIATLVEKPISNSIKHARGIVQTAKESGAFLMVGHVERFNPVVTKLKTLIDQNYFGEILQVSATRVGVIPPKNKGSDVVIDLAIHDLDVFRYLLDKKPLSTNIVRKKVFGSSFADVASLQLNYRKAIGTIQVNWITPIKMRRLYLTSTEGFVEVDYIKQKMTLYEKLLEIVPAGNFFDLVNLYDAPRKEVYIEKGEPLEKELEYFLDHVGASTIDPVVYSGLDALELCVNH